MRLSYQLAQTEEEDPRCNLQALHSPTTVKRISQSNEEDCRACRRPGTNRLMGGGFPQLQNHGGSCYFEDCELGHNFDDLTNIGTELSFAFNQVLLCNICKCL